MGSNEVIKVFDCLVFEKKNAENIWGIIELIKTFGNINRGLL